MAFGVFMHRSDSIYEDIPSSQYQFPEPYLTRAQTFVGDWIVYLEPTKVTKTRGYFAIARVQEIIPDPNHHDMYIAVIEPGSYLDFSQPVPFQEDGNHLEQGLLNDAGKISGRARSAVRPISAEDFDRILQRGLIEQDDILPRHETGEMQEASIWPDLIPSRKRVDILTQRPVRDRNFRKMVLHAYDERCAITGIRLINGGGDGEDRLYRGAGADTLNGGSGVDDFVFALDESGLDTINDFSSDDTVLIYATGSDAYNDAGTLLAGDLATITSKLAEYNVTFAVENNQTVFKMGGNDFLILDGYTTALTADNIEVYLI